ncbi:MAG: S24/S26 family peptidase [Eubacteriales bacterium]|nr:S24/S26 family peptidase [Eubacteriales bacterium]
MEKEYSRISLDEWHEKVKAGDTTPITSTLTGSSMYPLIRNGRDRVTIEPLNGMPQRGDIVLFKRPDGIFSCHRVIETDSEGATIRTFGDNCRMPDDPVPLSLVYGKVTKVLRDGVVINTDTDAERQKGLRWLNSGIKRKTVLFLRRVHNFVIKTLKIKNTDYL